MHSRESGYFTPVRGHHEKPRGLNIVLEAIPVDLEAELVEMGRRFTFERVVIHGMPSKRSVAHFGIHYAAESFALSPANEAPAPLHQAVDIASAALSRPTLKWEEFLFSHYPPGAGIGRHRDAPAFGTVLGISLLSPCTMQFESGTGTERRVWEQWLPPRSAYLLEGPARWQWRHGIDACTFERFSVTARTMRSSRDG